MVTIIVRIPRRPAEARAGADWSRDGLEAGSRAVIHGSVPSQAVMLRRLERLLPLGAYVTGLDLTCGLAEP